MNRHSDYIATLFIGMQALTQKALLHYPINFQRNGALNPWKNLLIVLSVVLYTVQCTLWEQRVKLLLLIPKNVLETIIYDINNPCVPINDVYAFNFYEFLLLIRKCFSLRKNNENKTAWHFHFYFWYFLFSYLKKKNKKIIFQSSLYKYIKYNRINWISQFEWVTRKNVYKNFLFC